MKKIQVLLLVCMIPFLSYANVDSLQVRCEKNEVAIEKLQQDLRNQKAQFSNQIAEYERQIDALSKQIDNHAKTLSSTSDKLNEDISSTNDQVKENKESLVNDIKHKTLWGGVGIGIILILLVVVFSVLRKRIALGGTTIDSIKDAQNKMESVQKQLQEEAVKLDGKMVELLEAQMKGGDSVSVSEEKDHSLALKVADEVSRISLNLSRMDNTIRGYKQLSKAIERIKNNFMAQGYEIVDMLGKNYNECMMVNADFIIDENLPEGSQIITSIAKPQVNYNGVMIQKASITVSQNI